MNVLEVWLGAETDKELLGLIPTDKTKLIYELVRGYEKVYTTLTSFGLDIKLVSNDPIVRRWETGTITVRNQKTRERFNYVEVQGGYGLEPYEKVTKPIVYERFSKPIEDKPIANPDTVVKGTKLEDLF